MGTCIINARRRIVGMGARLAARFGRLPWLRKHPLDPLPFLAHELNA